MSDEVYRQVLKSLSIAVAAFTTVQSRADNLDMDGIDDAYEQHLLNVHAPILYTDRFWPAFDENIGIPVGVDWLLRHSWIRTNAGDVLMQFPTVEAALALMQALPDKGESLRIDNRFRGGLDPAEPRTWEHAEATAEGTYGRVWRPWPVAYPHLYSIQYYFFHTWNETAYSGGEGNHEGDWGCIDLTVDARANADRPPIIHAIYHNHGRQFFVTPEALQIEDGRPVLYTEEGTNEAWTNIGDRGKFGWPTTDGWATNADLDDACSVLPWYKEILCFFGDVNEYKIVRRHRGAGHRLDWLAGDGSVKNVGDNGVSLCGPEGSFLLAFAGRWGWDTDGIFYEGENPKSPLFNAKKLTRSWRDDSGRAVGPWTDSPYGTSLPQFFPYTAPGYFFYIPQLSPTVYVNSGAAREGRGTPSLPFRHVDLGAAMAADGGQVLIMPGSYDGPVTMSKPVRLTAPSGSVIIGQ